MKRKEICAILDEAMDTKEWEPCLNKMKADKGIPHLLQGDVVNLCRLARIYVGAAHSHIFYEHYMELALRAMRQASGYVRKKTRVELIRTYGYIYYSEYMYHTLFKRHFDKKKQLQKKDLLLRALHCYASLVERGGTLSDLYCYVHLRHKCAKDYTITPEPEERKGILKDCYEKYKEIVVTLRNKKKPLHIQDQEIYLKASYNLAVCGLYLLKPWSSVLREIKLLYDIPIVIPNNAVYYGMIKEMHNALACVMKQEHIPLEIQDIERFSTSLALHVPYAGDVYYTLGKLYQLAYELHVDTTYFRYLQKAEKYYTYACDIDMYRRKHHLPVVGVTHIYSSLLDIYAYKKKHDDFKKVWYKYNEVIHFPLEIKIRCTVRWLILRKKYAMAIKSILSYKKEEKKLPVRLVRQLNLFMDIIKTALRRDVSHLNGSYPPRQIIYFSKIIEKS